NVMGPGDVRAQVDARKHVAVVQGCAQTVTPGEVREEAVVFTPAAGTGRFTGSAGGGGAGARDTRLAFLPRALSKQAVAAKPRTIAFDTADIVGPHFPDQCQAARAHHPINEVNSTHCGLPELLALVALHVIASRPWITSVCVVSRCKRIGERGTAHVATVDLYRHVRAIAQFACDRHTANIGTEADTVQLDIFGIFKEIAGSTKGAINTDNFWLAYSSQATFDVRVKRVTAVIIQGIEAELGIIQLWHEPAEGDTELATIARFLVLPGSNDITGISTELRMDETACQVWVTLGQVQA